MSKVILASSSPRRKELLKQCIDEFIIDPSKIDESKYKIEDVSYYKAKKVQEKYPQDIILAADTSILFEYEVFGKPLDKEDAKRILRVLSGNKHQVVTYYTLLYKDQIIRNKVSTTVAFLNLSEKLIQKYVDSLSPLDKAGAYGIQDDEKYHFIDYIEGSYTNVVGLPIEEIKIELQKLGVSTK